MKKLNLPNYDLARVAIDPVIFTIRNKKLMVYLETREIDPFKNFKELPGGILLKNETAEEILIRKLNSIFGSNNYFFQHFSVFTSPKRDPRTRTVSIGFVTLIPEHKIKKPENFYSVESLPKTAFDHMMIIQKANEFLKNNLDHELAKQFMPETFPLNVLQIVYEVIAGEKLDNRNFRRKMISLGIVEDAGKTQKNVNHRPSTLYKFSDNS